MAPKLNHCFDFTEDYILDLHSYDFAFNIWLVFLDDWKHFKERLRRSDGLDETDKEFIDRMSGLDVAEGGIQKKNDTKNYSKKGDEDGARLQDESGLELCLWASYRGQTLARTVRGMMYYERSSPVPVLILLSCVNCNL